jgi:hypothetical protein
MLQRARRLTMRLALCSNGMLLTLCSKGMRQTWVQRRPGSGSRITESSEKHERGVYNMNSTRVTSVETQMWCRALREKSILEGCWWTQSLD